MEKKSTLSICMKSIQPILRSLRQNGGKEIVSINRPTDKKWKHSLGNELLVREVLNPLIDIVFQYKESKCYNYIPNIKNDVCDAWDYYERRFNNIYCALNQNLYISHNIYLKVLRIIEEVQIFVKSFSGAEGLPEIFFDINPNLKFYRVAFAMKEEDVNAYEYAVEKDMISYVPLEEFIAREEHLSNKHRVNEQQNLKHDEDDFFMAELAYTIRLVFLNDLTEYAV